MNHQPDNYEHTDRIYGIHWVPLFAGILMVIVCLIMILIELNTTAH